VALVGVEEIAADSAGVRDDIICPVNFTKLARSQRYSATVPGSAVPVELLPGEEPSGSPQGRGYRRP
jgi:hypothetical protein